jgi:monovalent cation:H+ antiporter-2, CPA2 family
VEHEPTLISTIAASLGLAFVLGLLAKRVRLPPLVGYLLAGVVVGPFTPGFVVDGRAQQLAEVGVILLMFGVGIHFSVSDLLAVRRIAVPGALVQMALATGLGALVSQLWGWSWVEGVVLGLCTSVASTVVLLRALDDRDMLDTTHGRIAVGWLVVEDLAMVIVLVLLPLAVAGKADASAADAASATGTELALAIGFTLAKAAGFVALMIVVGRRFVPWLLVHVARTGSRELFTLSVLAVALGVAVGASALFDVSFALGAFFAGVVVNGSDLSHEAARDSLPLQDAFSVLFFVAVGMLFDPSIVVERPLELATVVLIVMVGKSLAAVVIVRVFGHPLRTSLTIAASLAQVGEFSFILAGLGVSLGVLPGVGHGLIVATALVSIALNPVTFVGVARLYRWLAARPRLAARLRRLGRVTARHPVGAAAPRLVDHVVLVGHGRVGSVVGEILAERGIPYLVVEQDRATVEALRTLGLPVVHGDASRPPVLRKARLEHARLLVVATPDPYQARVIVELARHARPSIAIAARSHSERARRYLEEHGVHLALIAERELALGLAHYALVRMGCPEADANATIAAQRDEAAALARQRVSAP